MLFDFKCPTGHVFEANVSSDIRSKECPHCSETASRTISVPNFTIPFDGSYPGAALKWAKYHEKGSKKYD